MWVLLRYFGYLLIALGIGVVLNAIFSELPAPTEEVIVPITPPGSGAGSGS